MTRRRRLAGEPAAAPRVRAGPFGCRTVAALAAVAMLVVLALPAGQLLSARDTDVVGQFIAWRSFAAHAILSGDFPLWNPYTYAGQPFLAGFQSALFYPPNVIFLGMPVERAINLCFLLHLIWLGWGMALWGRALGLHRHAAAIAGLVLPLSGPVFPHLYAGHVSNICTMAWAPWILLGLHHWVADGRRRGLLTASAAAAMQVLAGHVQYAFYTAIGVALYTVLRSLAVPGIRWRALAGLLGVYGGAAALSAVQLLPGLAAAAEGLPRGRTAPLPRLLILSDYRVLPTRDAILAGMLRDAFNPQRTVVLERVPDPVPVPGASGTARVLSETSDTVEIDVETTAPAVLLVTDQYSRDWRARALSPGPQSEYDVLPADYVLRGIPLVAGRHHLMLEYEPSLLVLGGFVSILAVVVWSAAWRHGRGDAALVAGRSAR